MERLKWKAGNSLYPLPVVLVSCGDLDGLKNIITLAWVGTIASDPAMVSISVRPERYSHALIMKNKSFVINLATKKLIYALDWCGVKSGRDFDKFKQMKLTAVKAQKVSAPLIKESPINIECVIKDVKRYGAHDVFLSEVAAVNADPAFMNTKTDKFDFMKCKPICYCHGNYYEVGKYLGNFGFSVRKKRSR
ncbi:MAG: flavin reductase family protein [Elusimicrobiota bacterium]|jgi:flavin reductase (DIM6/NTAB) family NADH-FMN oxidoreductase RutF|nr:flavin reductase family protein [Elusimicrobiota bacterium]